MRSFIPCGLWTLVLGLPLACGNAEDGSSANDANGDFGVDSPGRTTPKAATFTFPGGGTSRAAQSLSAAHAPDSSAECSPEPTSSLPTTTSDVQSVCFYGADEPNIPAALIEQVVEVVGNDEWVHLRLTLNPDFVDNTYGDNAIGWGDVAAEAPPAPPDGAAPPDAVADPAPPRAAGPADARPPRERPARGDRPADPKKGGHTFRDLVGSDHAEIQLLNADGAVSMHFKIDYISVSESAASGYASLGVTGGEGALIAGEPEWVLATTTSLERNLEACGLSAFTESSPATDEAYTPNADASDWDYRVSYEIWVSSEAFGGAGFGSALIENVHASPSKLEGNTVDVKPGPCPVDPGAPEAVPQPLPPVLENIR